MSNITTDRLIDEVSTVLGNTERLLLILGIAKGYNDLYSLKTSQEVNHNMYLLYLYIHVLQLWVDDNLEDEPYPGNDCIIQILSRITCLYNNFNCEEYIENGDTLYNTRSTVFGGTIPDNEIVLKLADGSILTLSNGEYLKLSDNENQIYR